MKEVLREPSIAQVAMAASSDKLEIGTLKMNARPYFRPSLDKNFTTEKFTNKVRKYLK